MSNFQQMLWVSLLLTIFYLAYYHALEEKAWYKDMDSRVVLYSHSFQSYFSDFRLDTNGNLCSDTVQLFYLTCDSANGNYQLTTSKAFNLAPSFLTKKLIEQMLDKTLHKKCSLVVSDVKLADLEQLYKEEKLIRVFGIKRSGLLIAFTNIIWNQGQLSCLCSKPNKEFLPFYDLLLKELYKAQTKDYIKDYDLVDLNRKLNFTSYQLYKNVNNLPVFEKLLKDFPLLSESRKRFINEKLDQVLTSNEEKLETSFSLYKQKCPGKISLSNDDDDDDDVINVVVDVLAFLKEILSTSPDKESDDIGFFEWILINDTLEYLYYYIWSLKKVDDNSIQRSSHEHNLGDFNGDDIHSRQQAEHEGEITELEKKYNNLLKKYRRLMKMHVGSGRKTKVSKGDEITV